MIRWLVRAMGKFRISSILSLLARLRVGDFSKGGPIMSFNIFSNKWDFAPPTFSFLGKPHRLFNPLSFQFPFQNSRPSLFRSQNYKLVALGTMMQHRMRNNASHHKDEKSLPRKRLGGNADISRTTRSGRDVALFML